MVNIKTIFLAVLAPLIVVDVNARDIFYNSGTRSGWDFVREEHNGRVEQVSNVAYKGGSALKMTQTYDPNYSGRYHSECDVSHGYRRNEERFYGFMFRLSEGWQFQQQSYNIAQFIAHRPGTGCGGDWTPTSMIYLLGNQLTTRIVSGTYVSPACTRSIDFKNNLAAVTAGQWHKIIIQARWRSDNSGFYKMWYDGRLVVEEYNRPTTLADDFNWQFRVGLYANGWYDDKSMQGTQGFRQVWYDEIAIGTTFKNVDPDQW